MQRQAASLALSASSPCSWAGGLLPWAVQACNQQSLGCEKALPHCKHWWLGGSGTAIAAAISSMVSGSERIVNWLNRWPNPVRKVLYFCSESSLDFIAQVFLAESLPRISPSWKGFRISSWVGWSFINESQEMLCPGLLVDWWNMAAHDQVGHWTTQMVNWLMLSNVNDWIITVITHWVDCVRMLTICDLPVLLLQLMNMNK